MSAWPTQRYEDWSATCDTLHAHTQVLGKLAAVLAPPEPQLQHAALRLTARGWETLPLPAPDGSGAFVVALDLHRARGAGRDLRRQAPGGAADARPAGRRGDRRPAGGRVAELAGAAKIDSEPQEVAWTAPARHRTPSTRPTNAQAVADYFGMATRAAAVLAAFRAPFRGRSTPVNAWWGSFDLAVSLFSGDPATPPSDDFIMRNAMDSQEVAVGWWPGDPKHGGAAFYAYAHPAQPGFAEADLGRRGGALGRRARRVRARVGRRGRRPRTPTRSPSTSPARAFRHACTTCGWDADLAATAEGTPPPVA